MADANDMELMRRYAEDNSENAFAVLVRRHITMPVEMLVVEKVK